MGCASLCNKLFREKQKQRKGIVRQQSHNFNEYFNKGSMHQLQKQTKPQVYQPHDENTKENKNQIRKANYLNKEQIEKRYNQARKDEKHFYELLSRDMTNFYMDLSKQQLQFLNQHKKQDNQAKVSISQQMLLLSLDVFQIMGKSSNFQYTNQMFQRFNLVQEDLMKFLKAKYPRAGNIFVPGDLNEKFKNFNMIQNYQNQIIRNSGMYFASCNHEKTQLVNTLKTFFNKLFQQLDTSFPRFEKLLQQQVFYYQQDGKQKTLSYKIGRKIPENVAKFQVDNTAEMQITSPQLFRTIIKWNQYLQQFISNPEESIKNKQTFNIYKIRKGMYQAQIINAQEINDIIPQLITKFAKANEKYKSQMDSFRKQIGTFNANLLKILFTTKRKQKFIPKEDANVIKYAYFNMHVISWVVKQILIFLIQKLIEVGEGLSSHGRQINVNLVSFLISDLMRSMVTGSKKQILRVFNNILQLQKKGELKVIKIKNRLGTLLNDAMIIFTIKGSFIICQLQLVLSESSSSTSEKLKYIQTMHHFFYELERSPYGVLSQIAVLLGFKDSKIAYCENIGFETNEFFKSCQKYHPEKILPQSEQKNPIICITCSQFYNPYQNMFSFKKCNQCSIYQCCTCSFSNDTKRRLQQIGKKFNDKFIATIKYPGNMQTLRTLFVQEKFQLRNIRDKYVVLTGKRLHNYLKQKQHIKTSKKGHILQKQDQTVFLLVKFKGNNITLKQFFWNKEIQQYQNCFRPNQVISQMNKVVSSEFDFIYFFETQKMINVNYKTQSRFKMFSIQDFQTQGIQKYFIIQIDESNAYLLRYEKNNDKNFENLKIPSQVLAKKKSFGYKSVSQARKKYPKFTFVQQNFSMVNSGLSSILIQRFFQDNTKTNPQLNRKIKQINLSNNLIIDASCILGFCPNLQKIILSENFIKEINFSRYQLEQVKVLIMNNNLLEDLQGLNELKKLQKLKIGNNQLTDLQPLKLPELKQFSVYNNNLDSIQWLQQSYLPKIQTIDASFSGIQRSKSHLGESLIFNFPKLNQLIFNNNVCGFLNIKSQVLQSLSANNCEIQRLTLPMKEIINLSLCNNKIKNLDDILSSQMPNAKSLKLNQAGQVPMLPKMRAKKLNLLHLSNCNLNNVNNLKLSDIPEINEIDLSKNKNIKRIPVIKFNKLKTFNTQELNLKNLNFLSNQQQSLPQLQQLTLNGCRKPNGDQSEISILQCPILSSKHLRILKIQSFPFSNLKGLSESQLSQLKILKLGYMKLDYLQKIHFSKLQQLYIQQVRSKDRQQNMLEKKKLVQNLYDFQQSQLRELKHLQIKNSSVRCLQMATEKQSLLTLICQNQNIPELKQVVIVTLKKLSLRRCQINKIKKMSDDKSCWFPGITQIDLSYNNIKQVPNVSYKNLKHLNLSNNKIEDLQQFAKSSLQVLQCLDLSNNNIVRLPGLKLRLKYFILDFNPIESINNILDCSLENLNEIRFVGLKNLKNQGQFNKFKFNNAKDFIIVNSNIRDLSCLKNWEILEVQTFILGSNFPIDLPKLKIPRLKKFFCYYSIQNENEQIITQINKVRQIQNEKYEFQSPQEIKQQLCSQNREKDNLRNLSTWQCFNIKTIILKNMNMDSLPRMSMLELQNFIIRSSYVNSITQFKNSQLPSLQKLVFFRVKNLKQFKVSQSIASGGKVIVIDSDIEKVEPFINSSCSALILSNNKIKQIGKMQLRLAQTLILNYNQLTDMKFLTISPKLKILRLKDNRIKQIPEIYFQQLSQLHLINNIFQKLKLNNSKFPQLQYIFMSENQIQNIESIAIQKIHEVSAPKNKLKSIDFFNPNQKQNLSNLNFADNQINKIVYIPPTKCIHFENNPIKTLSWVNPQNSAVMQTLVMTNTELTNFGVFGQSSNKLNQLIKLDLSRNLANSFPSVQRNFQNLIELNLSYNYFVQTPEFPVDNFPLLEILDLSYNQLTIFKTLLNKLKYLRINNNRIRYIHININSLQILRDLIIHDNELKDIQIVTKCPCLMNLQAQNNKITKVPDLSINTSLQKFQLKGNPLNNFQNIFNNNLQQLDNLQITHSFDNYVPIQVQNQVNKRIQQLNLGNSLRYLGNFFI